MQQQKIWKEPVMDGEKEKIIYPVGTPRELAESIVKILDKKFARDIKLLYVEEKTIIADYFVICTGGSVTQIKTLADEVEERLLDSASRTPYRWISRGNMDSSRLRFRYCSYLQPGKTRFLPSRKALGRCRGNRYIWYNYGLMPYYLK